MTIDYKVYNGVPTFNRSKFTIVGNPSITDDGVFDTTDANSNNCCKTPIINLANANTFIIELPYLTVPSDINQRWIIRSITSNTDQFAICFKAKNFGIQINDTYFDCTRKFNAGERVKVKIEYTGTNYKIYTKLEEGQWTNEIYNSSNKPLSAQSINIGDFLSQFQYLGLFDLKQLSIELDNQEAFKGYDIVPKGVNVIGTPNITNDGIASGFSSNNYIYTNWINTNNFVIETPYLIMENTPVSSNIESNFISCYPISSIFRVSQFSYTNGNFGLTLTTKANSPASAIYNSVIKKIPANTRYRVKLIYDGIKVDLYYQLDGSTEWVFGISNTVTFDTDVVSRLILGATIGGDDYCYKGSIDLKQFSIEVDGKEVFSGSRKGTITDKFIYLNDTKELIRQAIISKGVDVSVDTPFREYADRIGEIVDTSYKPYTKTPNLIYDSSQIINGNILYNGIWTKRYRTFSNASTDLMYANVPFNFNNKFEFLYHINSDSLDYTSRISGFSQSSSAQLLQTGINESRQIYLDIKEKDSDSDFKSLISEYTYNVNTDYFIKIVYDGSSKIELFVSVDNKVFQKIGELAITINYSVLCQVYFACSTYHSSARDLSGAIDFNYVHFLYPDNPENNWYAMS